MSKFRKDDTPESVPLEDQVQAFAPCPNFPRERAGVLALAQALGVAAKNNGVAPEDLVARCARSSTFCPTPADLFKVAFEMREERDKTRTYRTPSAPRCERCGDTGWITRYWVSDAIAGGKERFQIEAEDVPTWEKRIRETPGCAQQVYSEADRCGCAGRVSE